MDNNFQYLFLGGIIGEILSTSLVGDYLKESEKILKQNGISETHFTTLTSKNKACTNAVMLVDLVKKLANQSDKKIVIFAHSKGCLEALLALKLNKILFKDRVHKIILVQPPLRGTPFINKLIPSATLNIWPGLKSLSKGFYQEELDEVLIKDHSYSSYLQKNVLVIKSIQDEIKNVSWILKPVYLFYKMRGHLSDGLLRIKDQSYDVEKFQQITLKLDHSDIFCSTKLSTKSTEDRSLLLKSIITWVTKEEEVNIKLFDSKFCLLKKTNLVRVAENFELGKI